jgi:hypothetical protein
MVISEVLTKLKELDEKKTIYNIHRCNAGWGIIFYHPDKDSGDFKQALSVDRYYSSFEAMVEGEWQKQQICEMGSKTKSEQENSVLDEHERIIRKLKNAQYLGL